MKMKNEKQKVKSIAAAQRDKHKPIELTLNPELSYGEFRIGESIANYVGVVEKELRGMS